MAVGRAKTMELKMAMGALRRAKWDSGEKIDIRPSEMMLLMTLSELQCTLGREVKVSELRDTLKLAPPTISLMLKAVEKEGLIERYGDKEDKRRVYLRATTKGKILQEKMMKKHDEMLERFVEFLGEEDVDTLIRIIKKAGEFKKAD